ncbi:MAG: hypothetical protein WDM85_09595 [Caulobacteraceae bacterium]
MNRSWAAVIGVVILAFGGGFLFAKGVDGTLFDHARAGDKSAFWSMFGHPRDANAPRAGEQKSRTASRSGRPGSTPPSPTRAPASA